MCVHLECIRPEHSTLSTFTAHLLTSKWIQSNLRQVSHASVGDLTLHSPRRASMAGSVRDVTAHLLDDAQPDAMSQAEPIAVQQIVGTVTELAAPVVAGLPARPAGEPTAYSKPSSV